MTPYLRHVGVVGMVSFSSAGLVGGGPEGAAWRACLPFLALPWLWDLSDTRLFFMAGESLARCLMRRERRVEPPLDDRFNGFSSLLRERVALLVTGLDLNTYIQKSLIFFISSIDS